MKDSVTEVENTQNMKTSENEPPLEQNVENCVTGATTSDTVDSADVCQDDTKADSADHQCDQNNSLPEGRLDNLSVGGQDNTEIVCEPAKDRLEISSDNKPNDSEDITMKAKELVNVINDNKPNDSEDITKKAKELVDVIYSNREEIKKIVDDMQTTGDDKSRQLELNRSSSEETSVKTHDSANISDNSSEHPSVNVSDSAAITQDDKSDKLRIEEPSSINCSDSAMVGENTGTMSPTENVNASPVDELNNGTDEKEDADVEIALHSEPAIQDEIVPDTEDKAFSDENNAATDTVFSSENTVEINNQSEPSDETQETVVSPGDSTKGEETISVEEAATVSEVAEAAAVSEKDATEAKADDMSDVSWAL